MLTVSEHVADILFSHAPDTPHNVPNCLKPQSIVVQSSWVLSQSYLPHGDDALSLEQPDIHRINIPLEVKRGTRDVST